jgi:hypothetical protein
MADLRAKRKRGRGALTGSTWWAPRALAWWVAVLFIIGSTCFAIGPMPGYLSLVGYNADAITFFIGSIFFTSAALLQYIEVEVTPDVADPRARRLDWWAAAVQFVGTLWFNVTTFAAIHTNLTETQARRRIWTPDAIGSICFLIASELAFMEIGQRWFSWQPRRRAWKITALNLLGSIAFGVSAIASYVLPTTGDPLSVFWTNFGTFVGALCFLTGAVLLLPERTHPDE